MPITIPLIAADGATSTVTVSDPSVIPSGQILPATRVVDWTKAGMISRGGIPLRTTIYKTFSPSGGDDTPAIQAALDSCPENQVVKLTAGVFKINATGLGMHRNNVTLRGAGPGTGGKPGGPGSGFTCWQDVIPDGQVGHFVADPAATQLLRDPTLGTNGGGGGQLISVGFDGTGEGNFKDIVNLTADAALGAKSIRVSSAAAFHVGDMVHLSQITDNNPDVLWGVAHDPAGGGSRRWYCRQDRSLQQTLMIAAINGTTITFETALYCNFFTKYTAQLCHFDYVNAGPVLTGIGIEELAMWNGVNYGNCALNCVNYSWVKHVDSGGFVGSALDITGCYRCEIRDSFFHDALNVQPGGNGYLVDFNWATSDCLFENNITWLGNKVIVMRGTGGGNVIGYNYFEDAFGTFYPDSPEAGLNAGHFTTPHMELLEGNCSFNYQGDCFWGNSIDITVFRNWLTGLRAAHKPLNSYVASGMPYSDIAGRRFTDIQGNSIRHNFIGNVLGYKGQALLPNPPGYNYPPETSWLYDNISGFHAEGVVPIWQIGAEQDGDWHWIPTAYLNQWRTGNWDWVNAAQIWYKTPQGASGLPGDGSPQTLPNSLYLTSKPAFFGNNPWPWVDPSTGTTYVLPAKARFDAGTPNNIPSS